MTRLDEIRARVDAATPGPWRSKWDRKHEEARVWAGYHQIAFCDGRQWGNAENDAVLIAHAPEDLRILLAVAEAASRLLALPEVGEVSIEEWNDHSIAYNEAYRLLDAALAALDEGPA